MSYQGALRNPYAHVDKLLDKDFADLPRTGSFMWHIHAVRRHDSTGRNATGIRYCG